MTPTEALLDYLDQRGLALDPRYVREALHTLAQALMESEVGQMLDAARYERNESRRAYRNGYRDSAWGTPAGEIALRVPKLRKGSYYPHFLNQEAAQTLFRLVQAAYAGDMLDINPALASLDLVALSDYDLADIAERLDDMVYNAQHRSISPDYDVLFLDTINVEFERSGRTLWRQLLVALGVRSDGRIDFLAHDIVAGADDRAWMTLLRQLRQRGLDSVREVVSDHYEGVRIAVETELVDAVWQHHRNFLARENHTPLVDAVSDLVIRAESDDRNLPRLHLPDYAADFAEFYPIYIVA